jgi:hypothetical protein
VKFCFCKHCHIPVAKHNFRSRHHHFNEELPSSPAGADCKHTNTVDTNKNSHRIAASLESSIASTISTNNTSNFYPLGILQQFLPPTGAALLTANPPVAADKPKLLHPSILDKQQAAIQSELRKLLPIIHQMPDLSNNASARINAASTTSQQLLVQDLFAVVAPPAAAPKGDLFAGEHNRFLSNIMLGPTTVSSAYNTDMKQQQQHAAQVGAESKSVSSSVPDTTSRTTWPCKARRMDETHKRVSQVSFDRVCVFFDSMLVLLWKVDSLSRPLLKIPHMLLSKLAARRRHILRFRAISNMVTNWSVLTLLAKARGSSSAFANSVVSQLPSHAFVVATTTAILHLQPMRLRRLPWLAAAAAQQQHHGDPSW